MTIRTAARVLLLVAAVAAGGLLQDSTAKAGGPPASCGDIDGNGKVTASDALAVLHRAVGLDTGAYQCELIQETTTTTEEEVFSDCNSDSDCEFHTGKTHCCAYECSECENDSHCPEGQYCGSGCGCIPY